MVKTHIQEVLPEAVTVQPGLLPTAQAVQPQAGTVEMAQQPVPLKEQQQVQRAAARRKLARRFHESIGPGRRARLLRLRRCLRLPRVLRSLPSDVLPPRLDSPRDEPTGDPVLRDDEMYVWTRADVFFDKPPFRSGFCPTRLLHSCDLCGPPSSSSRPTSCGIDMSECYGKQIMFADALAASLVSAAASRATGVGHRWLGRQDPEPFLQAATAVKSTQRPASGSQVATFAMVSTTSATLAACAKSGAPPKTRRSSARESGLPAPLAAGR